MSTGYATPFRIDHHRKKPHPDVMSCEEIRGWLKFLITHPDWRPIGLARAMGVAGVNPLGSLKWRISGKGWIYPKEQFAMTQAIRRILAGELVCRQVGGKWEAVVADQPRPLSGRPQWRYNIDSGRLELVQYAPPRTQTLPSFRALMANARVMEDRWL